MNTTPSSSLPSAQLRTGRRDPYREISRLGTVADAFCYPLIPGVMGPRVRGDDMLRDNA